MLLINLIKLREKLFTSAQSKNNQLSNFFYEIVFSGLTSPSPPSLVSPPLSSCHQTL